MVDTQFSDARLAALYDLCCPWDARGDFTLYLPLVMTSFSVLDPAAGMLQVARARPDVEWILVDRVAFTHTYSSPGWDVPRRSRSVLRFLGPEALAGFLTEAGLVVAEQYGDWDLSPLTETSPEIITVARRG
ncbi:hypothetical protein ABZ490_20670 [Streptomyces sp. NPDC005811]|uniref:hypothetical protein n=1 Tax=Streptomyces sp. NPDC005811 TaxID=3154565 RepID=UPI0034092A0D